MRIRFLAVGVCLLALAACNGGNGASEAPQAIPAETTVATTTTVAPTTTEPKGLGVTQNYRYEDPDTGDLFTGKVTVFRYRDSSVLPSDLESELAKESKRSAAVEVRICVTKAPSPGVPLSWAPWSVGDDQGASYEAWISYSDDVTVQPPYPNEKITPAGTCRRGWVSFELPRTWKPDFVEYNTGQGNILNWPIST